MAVQSAVDFIVIVPDLNVCDISLNTLNNDLQNVVVAEHKNIIVM